jgi:hypothetical protein
MDVNEFEAVPFDELPDASLFWLSRAEEPAEPYDLRGPYKKNVYEEMGRPAPEKVYVRRSDGHF